MAKITKLTVLEINPSDYKSNTIPELMDELEQDTDIINFMSTIEDDQLVEAIATHLVMTDTTCWVTESGQLITD
jgi:hypothetical protein